jgi:hypothetical protein
MKRRSRGSLPYGTKRPVRAVRIEDAVWARIVAEAKRRTALEGGPHEIGPSEVLRTLATERLDNIADELGRASDQAARNVLEKPPTIDEAQRLRDLADEILKRTNVNGSVATDIMDRLGAGAGDFKAAIAELLSRGEITRSGAIIYKVPDLIDRAEAEHRKTVPARAKRKAVKAAPESPLQSMCREILQDWNRPTRAWELLPELERRGLVGMKRVDKPLVAIARACHETPGIRRAGAGCFEATTAKRKP